MRRKTPILERGEEAFGEKPETSPLRDVEDFLPNSDEAAAQKRVLQSQTIFQTGSKRAI